jgi:drug/metabolite transporter (DMT)-like permease
MDIFDILILVAVLAVVITLGLGFYSLYRGGEFAQKYSNKFMRLRVGLQFVAILLLVLGFYVHHH